MSASGGAAAAAGHELAPPAAATRGHGVGLRQTESASVPRSVEHLEHCSQQQRRWWACSASGGGRVGRGAPVLRRWGRREANPRRQAMEMAARSSDRSTCISISCQLTPNIDQAAKPGDDDCRNSEMFRLVPPQSPSLRDPSGKHWPLAARARPFLHFIPATMLLRSQEGQ